MTNFPFFEKSAVTFLILGKKSSFFLEKIALVEISSKMMSFVDILILGHPLPPLLRGTLLNFDDFLYQLLVPKTIKI